MVHNGIEYGLMAAYAEGVNVLAEANIGAEDHAADAETAPLDDAKYYRYDIDLGAVTELWRRGSVVTSWLLDLTAEAYLTDPGLDEYSGHVSDSGEGRWTIQAADRRGGPGARPVGCCLSTVQLARPLEHGGPGAVGDAGRVRWAP